MQKVESKERFIIFRLLHNAKCKYTHVEKICLSLFHACTKLEYYFLPNKILVLWKFDIVKHLSNHPVLQERLVKWEIKLNFYALTYVPLRVMNEQVLVDFVTQHPCVQVDDASEVANNYVSL